MKLMKRQLKGMMFFVLLLCTSVLAAQTVSVKDTVETYLGHGRRDFRYPGKQFFFQGEIITGFAEFGFKVVGGYRFGQFGLLGAGFGADGVLQGFSFKNSYEDPDDGAYFPIFVHYEGDILRKKITPFYTVEAGYSFRYSTDDSYITVTPLNHPAYKNQGGFTGDAEFGVKVYFTNKVYASWALAFDVKQAQDKYTNYYVNSIGENIKVSYTSSSFYYLPAIKIAVGF
jgi:hypothetical protein